MELEDGGTTRAINAIMFLVLFISNLMNQITAGKSIIERWYYTVPFLVFAILVYFIKSKHISALIFYAIAVGILLDPSNKTDFSSAIFFIFAFQLLKSKWSILVILTTNFFLLVLRMVTVGETIPHSLMMVIVFSYIYIIYYFLIYKPTLTKKDKVISRNIDVINITEEDKAIIKLYCLGYDYDKISRTLGLNVVPNTVRRKITAIKNQYKLKNDAHFGQWLFKRV